MRNYATKVRDKTRLKNLRNRRETTSNLGTKFVNFEPKPLGFLTPVTEKGVEGATGGFGGD